MLHIVIPAREYFDERTGEFVESKEQTLTLEHSLLSLSKWESKWHKSFLSQEAKTYEETIDYVRCMTINQVKDSDIYYALTNDNLNEINSYIENPMTATTFKDSSERPSREVVTSELIYYWMVSLDIPFECEKWHLNRLLTLVRVCNIKNAPGKKMSKKDIFNQNKSLNAARRARSGSKG